MRIHRAASDRLLVTCKWRHCCRFWALDGVSGVPIGALLNVLQQWLLVESVRRTFLVGLHRLRCWLQFHMECLVFCRVGSGDTFVAPWNVGAQAGCFIAAFGYRRPPRPARTSGGRESVAWVQMQLTRCRQFGVFSK